MLIQKRIPHYMLFHFLYILLILIKINCFIIFFYDFRSILQFCFYSSHSYSNVHVLLFIKRGRGRRTFSWITYMSEYLLLYNIDDKMTVLSYFYLFTQLFGPCVWDKLLAHFFIIWVLTLFFFVGLLSRYIDLYTNSAFILHILI